MILLIAFVICVFYLWVYFDKQKCRNFPPGPFRFPLIGCLPQIAAASSFPAIAFKKLAKKYGNGSDVIYLRMGLQNTVVFNTLDSIKNIMTHEKCQDRARGMIPLIMIRMCYKNLGYFFANGKSYQTLRRFSLRTLRDFGFGKAASMDIVVNEEAEKFLEYLEAEIKSGGLADLQGLLRLTTTNFLWRFVTSVNYEMNDKKILRLLKINDELFKSTNFAMDLSTAYPFLYHWFPNWMKKNHHLKLINNLKDFLRETIAQHESLGDYKNSPGCFVDVFLAKIEEEKEKNESHFNPEQLLLCLMDIFQAGSDTTSNTLSFCILYMIAFPEIQKRVQRELDENLGEDEMITLASKTKLPFTFATVLECIRYSIVVPISLPREASEDFYFKRYLIKKGMPLTLNLYAAHFDKDVWGDPDNFRPERFLNEGAVDTKVAGKLIQFGHGQRYCMGASLAETSVFIYFANIFRRFIVENERKEESLSLEPVLGVTYSPKPYKAKFIPRRA